MEWQFWLRELKFLPPMCLQAVLKNTIADYGEAGTKPKTKQLELRLIQSVKAIQSPEIRFLTEQL